MQRFWALLGAMTTVLVLVVVVPAPAGARGVNVPDHGGGSAQVHRRPLTVVKRDSRVPTYDYYVLTFDRRATHQLGRKSSAGAILSGLLGGVSVSLPQVAVVAGVATGLLGLLNNVATGAEHDRKCLALRVYVQRKKWINPPGPDVLVTKVYGTSKRCRGSYRHG